MTQDGAPRHADRPRLVLSLGAGLVVIALTAVAFLAGLGVLDPRPAATPLPAIAVAPTGAPPLPTSTAVPPRPTATRPRPTATPPPTATSSPTPEPGTSNVYIEYVLDASGSMVEALPAGRTKLALARTLLTDHLAAFRPETNVGLRAYGHRLPYLNNVAQSCQDIELIAPPAPGNLETLAAWLATFQAQGMTPLAESLRQALADFTFDPARLNSVVLLSDGIETCGGDPCRLVQALKAQGINFTIHVIGLDVDQPTREQLTCIAAAAGGAYHDAKSEQDLSQALAAVKQDVTEDEIITAHGLDTPTPPPTATFTPVPPTLTPTGTARPASSPTTPPGPPVERRGLIVYEHSGSSPGHQIWAMNADGSGKRQLTVGEYDTDPAWAPDGKRIAYNQVGSAGFRVIIINADGSGARRLVDSSSGFASWSPGGERLAFMVTSNRTGQIAVANADGSGMIVLTQNAEWNDFPAWSPDGSQIAFACGQSGNTWMDICIMDAAGSNVRRLTDSQAAGRAFYEPSWSPDGQKIVMTGEAQGDQDVFIMNADGSGLERLTPGTSRDRYPAWSPDGQQIVFASDRSGSTQIWVMSSDGIGATQLTSDGSNMAPDWWGE